MQIKYFQTAWNDIKNSTGWFGKLCLLALLNLIPIFGQVVTLGYLYGWAREIAWGTHEPLPQRIFGNEDGKFWRRGWFVFVTGFVFALVPAIVMSIGTSMQSAAVMAVSSTSNGMAQGGGSAVGAIGLLLYYAGLIGSLFLSILAWIASMRVSIYDRLSAGFQLGKIMKMFRHDVGGIMRVFGMNLLVGFILGFILSIILSVFVVLLVMLGAASMAAAGVTPNDLQHMWDVQAVQLGMRLFASVGIVGMLGFLVLGYAFALSTVFVQMLVVRAVGYWTAQFDVPRWRGQDDPMPFEIASPLGYQPYAAAPPYYPAPNAGQPPVQDYQPQGMPYGAGAQQPQQGVVAQPAPMRPDVSADSTTAPAPDSDFFLDEEKLEAARAKADEALGVDDGQPAESDDSGESR